MVKGSGSEGLISLDSGLIVFPFAVVDYIGNIVNCNEAFEEIFARESPVKGKHIRELDSDALWRLFLRCKATGTQIKERINIGGKQYEVVVSQNGEGYYFSVCLYEITLYIKIEEDLVRRNRELMIINTLSETFISSMDRAEFFKDLLTRVLMLAEYEIGMIVLLEEDTLRVVASSGLSPRFLKRIDEGVFEREVLRRLSFQKYPMAVIDETDVHHYRVFQEEGLSFVMIRQLMSSGKIDGYLILGSRMPSTFDFDLASLINLIGNHVSLIVEKFRLYNEAKKLSITDPLTGLYNVRYFYMTLKTELQRAKRYGENFAVVVFDIDNFKAINDTYGHQAGDMILQEFGRTLLQKSRKADIVARYGGEEFVLILPKTSKKEALTVAERICESISETEFEFLNSATGDRARVINITISGGVSGFPEDGSTEKELLYAADMAMYRAKAEGKGRVYLYDRQKDAKGIPKA